jgi:phosphoribosylanthranilate isomerase
MRVRAKICGITRATDAAAAVAAGADALGFVFYRGSARYVAPSQARSIIATLPPFVAAVGLFVDATNEAVCEAVAVSGVQLLQFQGHETNSQCVAAGKPFIKAVRVSGPVDAGVLERQYPNASAFQLDSLTSGALGGSGQVFDWSWWPTGCNRPLILAGGLRADNVADAIARTRPYAVDVSTGVEGDVKGLKDVDKINRFMREVQRANGRN